MTGRAASPAKRSRTRYTAERRAFDRLKADCPHDAKREYELAIRTLPRRYNTTIYENRFVVGGAVEAFMCALLRSAGLDCTLYGSQARGGDILLPNDRKISVKGTFRGVTGIRLLNRMGEGERKWTTATLFVVSGVGIAFGAPDTVESAHIESVGDAIVLKKDGLQRIVDNPENVFAMDIDDKPPTETTGLSLKASTAVARQILLDTSSAVLRQMLKID